MKRVYFLGVLLLSVSLLGGSSEHALWDSLKDYQPDVEKPMVIVVPSYNNKQWYQKNLDSIFAQNYTNYEIIYINDVSSDGTGKLVAEYVRQKKQSHRVTIINNAHRIGGGGNIYNAVSMIDDHKIVLELDGDDWFDNPNVLSLLNKVYTKEHVWLTYGQYKIMPNGRMGECETVPLSVIKNNGFRGYRWVTSHLRTWYAWLFKKIRKSDMVDRSGAFYTMSWDQAFMLPMLEMAAERVFFIPDTLYHYNLGNDINDYKVNSWLQGHLNIVIRRKPKYSRLPDSAAPNYIASKEK